MEGRTERGVKVAITRRVGSFLRPEKRNDSSSPCRCPALLMLLDAFQFLFDQYFDDI
jgi:hypothetical protein